MKKNFTCYLFALTFCLMSLQAASQCVPYLGTYYWVGGAGDWDDLTHWDTLPGGPGSAVCQVPQSFNDVVFDANSGLNVNNKVNLISTSVCRNLTWNTGVAGVGFAGISRLDVYASMKLEPNQLFNSWTGGLHFLSGGIDTLWFNGNQLYNLQIVFEPLNGKFTVYEFNQRYTGASLVRLSQGTTGTIDFETSFYSGRYVYARQGTSNFNCDVHGNYTAASRVLNFDINNNNAVVNFNADSYIVTFNARRGNFNVIGNVHDWYTFLTGTAAVPFNMNMTDADISMFGSWSVRNPSMTLISDGSILRMTRLNQYLRPGPLTYNIISIDKFYRLYSPSNTTIDSLIVKEGFFNIQATTFNILSLIELRNGGLYNAEYGTYQNSNRATFNIGATAITRLHGACGEPLALENMTFNFATGAAALIDADYVRLEATVGAGTEAPYEIGTNSYGVPNTNNITWVTGGVPLGVPVGRYLRWVGPPPPGGVTANNQYGDWYDANNWVDGNVFPLAVPGDTSLPDACPPTLSDSVLFPNMSYVKIDSPHAECKSMVWLQEGNLYDGPNAGNNRRLEIYGSLIFSPEMTNGFNGIISFRTWESYPIIQSSGKRILFKAIFEATADAGSWHLVDTFRVPNFINNNYVWQLRRGQFYTHGETVIAASFISRTGARYRKWALFDSDIYITGRYLSANRYPFEINNQANGLNIEAGTSHIHMTDETDNLYTRMMLGGGHTFYDITLYGPQPWISRYVDSGHNNYHYVTFNQSGRFLGTRNTSDSVKVLTSHTTNLTTLNFIVQKNNALANMVIDSAIYKGNTRFIRDVTYTSLMKLFPGRNYFINHATNYTQTLEAPLGRLDAQGTCLDFINISGGDFFSTIPQSISYTNLTNNTASSAVFSFSNSILNGTVTGWTGVSDLPRKLYWLDVTPGNSVGEWENMSNWSLADGVMLDAAGGNNIAIGNCPPTRVDTVVFSNGSFTGLADTVLIQMTPKRPECGTMLWTHNNTVQPVFKANDVEILEIYESLMFSASMQQQFDGDVQFRAITTGHGITSSGQEFNRRVIFVGVGGEWILQDSFQVPNYFNVGIVQNRASVRLLAGVLNTNDQVVRVHSFNSETTNPRSLILGNSEFNVLGVYVSATGRFPFHVINTSNNYDLHAGTSTIHFRGVQNSYYNGMRGGYDVQYNNVIFDYRASLFAVRDTFNDVKFTRGGYIRGTGSNLNCKFDKLETYSAIPLDIRTGHHEIDTMRLFGNAIIRGNNYYNHEISFYPARTYTFGSNQVQHVANGAAFNAIGTGGGGEITFNATGGGNRAFIRKDSGRVCVDYIYMRDNWAIGDGFSTENPLCVSNPLCDTVFNSSFLPTSASSGRARFQAGANANNQGNNAGWDFTPYPLEPELLLLTPNQFICMGDSVLLEFEVVGQLPATVSYGVDVGSGNVLVDSIEITPTSGSGTPSDPYIWSFYVYPTVNTTFAAEDVSILRCFNDNAQGQGLMSIDVSCLLPIDLLDFRADYNNKKVDLSWETSSETNSSHFLVQRSSDGINFETIEQIAAQGTTTATSYYQTVDLNPLLGTSYYRLKLVDLDGKNNHSEMQVIEVDIAEIPFSVFPNPASTDADIQLVVSHSDYSKGTLEIQDVTGRVIHVQSIDLGSPSRRSVLKVNPDLSAGIYLFRWVGKNKAYTRKVIVK